MDADGHRQVRKHPPRIADVPLKPVIYLPAMRQVEARFLGREALPVAQRRKQQRVVERIRVHPTGKRGVELRREPIRIGVAAQIDVIHAGAEPYRVFPGAPNSVVAELYVVLKGFLRSKPARAKLYLPTRQIGELNARRQSQRSRTANLPASVQQGVVIAEIAEAETVNVGPARQIHSHRV